jgi:hypothetical protein
VVLGESAAAGYPLPEYGLGRLTRVLWGAEFPGEKLEVVDMTSVGVNSHVLRVFAREAMKTKPDDAGHNEIIGPYGPANVFGRQAPGVWFTQAGIAWINTRIGRSCGAWSRRPDSLRRRDGADTSWRGRALRSSTLHKRTASQSAFADHLREKMFKIAVFFLALSQIRHLIVRAGNFRPFQKHHPNLDRIP